MKAKSKVNRYHLYGGRVQGHQTQARNCSNGKGSSENSVICEMIPFFFYAAIPIAITIGIAFTFGFTHQ